MKFYTSPILSGIQERVLSSFYILPESENKHKHLLNCNIENN